jgi:hypothetical protein
MSSGTWALGGALQQTTVTISPSELLALAEHPVCLLAGPGAGKANVILAMSASLEFGGTAFTNPGSAVADVIYNGPSSEPAVASDNLASLLEATASEVQTLAPIATTYARAEMEAQQVLLSNSGADFTLGNGALVLSIIFAVVTL